MNPFNITTTKNLLAFSGGIDSTALFFLLHEQNIPFDITIVDYNIRAQSKQEVKYAKELASKYNKHCFIKEVTLQNNSNFEKTARDIRYKFFEEIIDEHNYETLLTAHQLNDKLEWFLMQLSRGAGLVEILGLQEYEEKESYKLIRPLLNRSKQELQTYLEDKDITYFIDESNQDMTYKRNEFRHTFSDNFLKNYQDGVKKSFEYLSKDMVSLQISYEPLFQEKELLIFERPKDDNLAIRVIDKAIKKQGILLSHAQRNEILKQKESVVSHKIAISLTSSKIWIAPYRQESMDKKFKEKCRVLKIPKNLRSYLFSENINLEHLTML